MGLAVGAVLGLVPDRTPAWRAGSFSIGFLVAWLGFALRAGWLPDIPLGRAIATAIVLALVTIATTVSYGRLPLWAGLLGVAAFSGGYETTFTNSPASFVNDSMTDATTIALAVALGFFATTLVDGLVKTSTAHVAVIPPPPPSLPPDGTPDPKAALPRQRVNKVEAPRRTRVAKDAR